MELVNEVTCKYGMCRLILGNKLQDPTDGDKNITKCCGISEAEFFEVSRESLTTPYETNIKVSKPCECIYKLSCKSCSDPFYFLSKNNKTNAIVAKGKPTPTRRYSNANEDAVHEQTTPSLDSIRDLIRIKGNSRSPVMLPQVSNTTSTIQPLELLEEFDCYYYREQEMVHDCLFGSYHFDRFNAENFVFV